MFSGRPNPTYEITDIEIIKKLQIAFEQKKLTRQNVTQESKLGYSGIQVENIYDIPGIPNHFIITNGIIIITDNESNRKFLLTRSEMSRSGDNSGNAIAMDENRELEKFLLVGEMKDLIK